MTLVYSKEEQQQIYVDAVAQVQSGIAGKKVSRAAAGLPQTAQAALFTVSGGRVAIKKIVGQVTTAIQNQINNTKLVSNPTVGNDADLCAVLDIANLAVGQMLSISGTPGDALRQSTIAQGQDKDLVVKPGAIDLSCAASNTGQIAWDIYYVPIDAGAAVVAA